MSSGWVVGSQNGTRVTAAHISGIPGLEVKVEVKSARRGLPNSAGLEGDPSKPSVVRSSCLVMLLLRVERLGDGQSGIAGRVAEVLGAVCV